MRRALKPTYQIGPMVVAFESDDSELLDWARQPHAGRETFRPAEATIELRRHHGVLAGPPAPELTTTASGYELAYHGWRATLDTVTARCVARISGSADHPMRGPRRVASLTRVLVGRLLLERGGLAFHGAALVHRGRGFLFVGRRGAGKTTLVTRFPGDRVLGDDHAFVMPGSTGFRLFGTPYAGREGTASVVGDAPLAAVHVIAHGERTEATRLNAAHAFRQLTPHVIHAGSSASGSGQVLDALHALVTEVDTHDLRVNLNQPLWPVVDGALFAAPESTRAEAA